MKTIISFLLIFLFLVDFAYAQNIVEINVEGNVRIDKPTILSVVKEKTNSPLNIKAVNEDIKNIYNLGFFETVSANIKNVADGVILTFNVKEKPSIRFVKFEGNKMFKDEELYKVCKTKEYQILSKKNLQESVAAIVGFYAAKGIYLTNVSYKLEPVSGNRVDVVFQIREGKKTFIHKINIIGNKHIKTSDILDVMKNHKKYGPYLLTFLPWFYTGKLNPQDLDSDIQSIRDLYLSKGYADVKVEGPTVNIEPDTGYIDMDISIDEGAKYTLKSLKFEHIEPYTLKELEKIVQLKVNKIFNGVQLRKDIENLTTAYADKGYAFCDINPIVTLDRKNHTVDVTFDINKGNKVYIHRIEITGNDKTWDNVIRREIRLDQGSLFSESKIKESREKIYNTDYFDDVKISTDRVPGKDEVNMKVNVKEKMTGMLSLGVGYSSYYKVGVMGSVTQRNLFGSGIYGKLYANLSANSHLFDVSFVNPWVDNRPISVGLDLYNMMYYGWDYDQKTYGFKFTVAKRFYDDQLSVGASYSLSQNKINITAGTPSYYLLQEEGTTTESTITPFIKWSSINNTIFPTRGTIVSSSLGLTGFGGNTRYIKWDNTVEYFHPIFWSMIGHLKGSVGFAKGIGGKGVPLQDRYFLGGIDSLRGFDYGTVSPTDEYGNYIGGTRDAYAQAETIFPLVEALKLYGEAFFDIGNSWLYSYDFGNLKKDVGVGIKWISPLGPIRVEVGKNLAPKNGEKSYVFQFSMGALF
ncbi:outer membrane protein assembly factor BamA [Desulfurella sp.]|uniref:outer membrane protein assembly factor BamA n=1 Tax=Desulfurella sp. TaxID=1962857 RepID=UPI003D1288C8